MSMLRTVAIVATTALGLTGCGNQTDEGIIAKTFAKGGLKKAQAGNTASPEQVAAAVQAALAGSELPLALGVVEQRNTTALLTRIETNGAYATWASPDRRTLTARGGIVTATRGLGNDLMSSDISGVAGLITQRKAGNGQRVMRYLNGENQTIELVAQCSVSRGGQHLLSAGEIKNRVTTEMTESCSAEGRRFTNRYLVDGQGRPVQSRQWLSPASGHITIQRLR